MIVGQCCVHGGYNELHVQLVHLACTRAARSTVVYVLPTTQCLGDVVCGCVCMFSVTVECWRLHGASGKSLLSSSPLSASLRASPCVFAE